MEVPAVVWARLDSSLRELVWGFQRTYRRAGVWNSPPWMFLRPVLIKYPPRREAELTFMVLDGPETCCEMCSVALGEKNSMNDPSVGDMRVDKPRRSISLEISGGTWMRR